MGTIGKYMILAGGLSIVLGSFDYELTILSWIDNWGTNIAWAIRIGLLAFGGALVMQEMRQNAPQAPPADPMGSSNDPFVN